MNTEITKKPPHTGFFVKKLDDMTRAERVVFICLVTVGVILTLTFGIWWFQAGHISHNFNGVWHALDYVIFIVLSYIVWHHIIMEIFSWYIAAHIKRPEPPPVPEGGLKVAYLTAFVPGAEPYDVLERTLTAMAGVDYPHDTWLLDEGDDEGAKAICAAHGVKHYSRKGKDHLNTSVGKFKKKTKEGNYNAWLHHYDHEYDIVAQHDVDFIPRKDYLMRTLGYFKDSDVAFVGAPQVYGNRSESWIARGAAEQTYGFYGPLQKGFYSHDMTLLIGANHIVRTKAYRDIGGYAAHITEDMLTGMKLYAHGNKWKSVYVPEVLLIGEGPATWSSYLSQQLRWSYGCMDIVFRHAPALLSKMSVQRACNFILLQQFYFSGVAQVAGIGLLTLYFFFGVTSANMTLLPILVFYVPLVVYQILFQLWIQRFNIDPTTECGLLLRGRLLALAAWPVYFIAFLGVIQDRPLTYVVTPKGSIQLPAHYPSLFVPHFLLGSITFIGILAGYYLGHSAPQIVFWAVINTAFMYYFFFSEAVPVGIRFLGELVYRYRLKSIRLYPKFNLAALLSKNVEPET
ncbi:MAG: glycosyltransferase family 2 protein [bacterium]|nr:glycosyltransferase family 2 protein [bacterium]